MLDASGELVVAVSNMAVTDRLTVRQLMGSRDLLSHADLLVLDGNIPEAPAAWLLDFAAAVHVPVVMDPVSVAKARPLAQLLSPQRPLLALTPNLDELSAIVGETVADDARGHHQRRTDAARPRGPQRLGATAACAGACSAASTTPAARPW